MREKIENKDQQFVFSLWKEDWKTGSVGNAEWCGVRIRQQP